MANNSSSFSYLPEVESFQNSSSNIMQTSDEHNANFKDSGLISNQINDQNPSPPTIASLENMAHPNDFEVEEIKLSQQEEEEKIEVSNEENIPVQQKDNFIEEETK